MWLDYNPPHAPPRKTDRTDYVDSLQQELLAYREQNDRLQQLCDLLINSIMEEEGNYGLRMLLNNESLKSFGDIIDKAIGEIVKGNAKEVPKGILNCFGEGR